MELIRFNHPTKQGYHKNQKIMRAIDRDVLEEVNIGDILKVHEYKYIKVIEKPKYSECEEHVYCMVEVAVEPTFEVTRRSNYYHPLTHDGKKLFMNKVILHSE